MSGHVKLSLVHVELLHRDFDNTMHITPRDGNFRQAYVLTLVSYFHGIAGNMLERY